MVRPNCKGYEVVAGQRRLLASQRIAEGTGNLTTLPCILMDDSDDAAAIEASLAENIARLPMDQWDQYDAFSRLVKEGRTPAEVASDFGITERLVSQRLALSKLIGPIKTAARKGEIEAETIRSLTLASTAKQKEWIALHKEPEQHAPRGYALKQWLFGGTIRPDAALFDLESYPGEIVSDLFGEDRYFADAGMFWDHQLAAIEAEAHTLRGDGWTVEVLEIGQYWPSWDFQKAPKAKGGKVFIEIDRDGTVEMHKGYLSYAEARRTARPASDEPEAEAPKAERAELTKPLENYIGLHRHAAIGAALTRCGNQDAGPRLALRFAVAAMLAPTVNLSAKADKTTPAKPEIAESVAANPAAKALAETRNAAAALAGIELDDGEKLTDRRGYFGEDETARVFAALLPLDDTQVLNILAVIVAETLPAGSGLAEALAALLKVDMAECWQPDDAFWSLVKDKRILGTMLAETAGKQVADANRTATGKVMTGIIRDCLGGTNGRVQVTGWLPRWLRTPMQSYTDRPAPSGLTGWQRIRDIIPL